MRDVLPILERWTGDGVRAAYAILVATDGSAPRRPGTVFAVSARGDVAGSITGGCVEPALYEDARSVLAGAPPRLVTYGIADEDAFEVGLPCGGTVHVFVDLLSAELVRDLATAERAERPLALAVTVSGPGTGEKKLFDQADAAAGGLAEAVRDGLGGGESRLVHVGERNVFVVSLPRRPRMYLFGAGDHAATLASLGRLLGYRVTVCDVRAKFVTRERFPDAEELVVEWPDRFLEAAPVDERTVICVFTHDERVDVPVLAAALGTPAGYIGAMGSRRTTAARAERLRAQGVDDAALARLHAPVGLPIGARTPQEIAVAIAAEIVSVANRGDGAASERLVATA